MCLMQILEYSTQCVAPVITDINDLRLSDKDICLIVRGLSKKMFLPSTAEEILQGTEKSWHFHNIALYLLEQKNLTDNQ